VLYLRSPTGALFDLTDIPTTPTASPPDRDEPIGELEQRIRLCRPDKLDVAQGSFDRRS
jgi:hypothetical protein